MIYDTVLDITWLQDANLFKTQYDADNSIVSQIIAAVPTITHTGRVPFPSPYTITAGDFNTSTGRMSWFGAMAWAEWLNFGGYSVWRLPSALNQDGTWPCLGSNCTSSEMGHMFYNNLGATAGNSILSGSNTANLALFTNIQSTYGSGTEYAPIPRLSVCFHTVFGHQGADLKGTQHYAWAVHPGDVGAAVPEPASVALVGLGLAVLG